MAGDWRGVQAGLTQGVQTGMAMGKGGRLGGLASAISKVATRLKSQRETGEALDLLGKTEDIKLRKKAEYAPTPEWTPKTQEEAESFEGFKVGAKAKPTPFQLQKEAGDEAYRRMGGAGMVGLDPDLTKQYESLADQIYQGYLEQYEYKVPKVQTDMPPTDGKINLLKSPYPEYPDAFQEDGVWKVKKGGKTYRIEE